MPAPCADWNCYNFWTKKVIEMAMFSFSIHHGKLYPKRNVLLIWRTNFMNNTIFQGFSNPFWNPRCELGWRIRTVSNQGWFFREIFLKRSSAVIEKKFFVQSLEITSVKNRTIQTLLKGLSLQSHSLIFLSFVVLLLNGFPGGLNLFVM